MVHVYLNTISSITSKLPAIYTAGIKIKYFYGHIFLTTSIHMFLVVTIMCALITNVHN